MGQWAPLTAAKRDRLPLPSERGWWSRVLSLPNGAGAMTQAGIITHRHQRRPDHLQKPRSHGPQGARGLGDGP